MTVLANSNVNENEMKMILSGITDAVIALDSQYNIILFNKAAEKLTGCKSDFVIGKPIHNFLKFFDKETEIKPTIYCPLHLEGFEGELFNEQNVKLISADNKITYVHLLVSQIKDAHVINLGGILTLHDISKEVKIEQIKLDFVSMAAHELRTPLTAIRGYASLVKSSGYESLDPVINEYINRLIISSENLENLIDNLLNVSRIEHGNFKILKTPLNVQEIIKEIAVNYKEQAISKNQIFEIIVPNVDIPLIMGDKFKISQVLSNLLINAFTFTSIGGKITIKVSVRNDKVQIEISDTGIGIPQDALTNLFTKFFRVSSGLEQGSKGTGLGLYIAKSIINIHHGEIAVASKVGVGTTFTIILPAATPRELQEYYQTNSRKTNTFVDRNGIILNEERLKKYFN